jgi:hypothetical protein
LISGAVIAQYFAQSRQTIINIFLRKLAYGNFLECQHTKTFPILTKRIQ